MEETVRFLKKNLAGKGKDDQKKDDEMNINFEDDDDDIKIEMKSIGVKKSQHSPLLKLSSETRQLNSLKRRPLFMQKRE